MPTAPSSTDPERDGWFRAGRDVGALLRFRTAGLRGRSRPVVWLSTCLVGVLTLLAGWLPAHLPGAAGTAGSAALESGDVLKVLPSAYLGVLLIAVVSSTVAGGGRELLPRDQAVAFPVSPTTDHLGALLMAPLNIAWLMQAWVVLAATAFVVGPAGLLRAQVPVLLWLVVATALAQAVAWAVEWVRRGPRGVWAIRALVGGLVAATAALVVTGRLVGLLDRAPTVPLMRGALSGAAGEWPPWLWTVGSLALLGVAAVAVGAGLAHAVARRPARDELRVETSVHRPRPAPASDLGALLRADRAGIWRAVPLRRGMAVLALLPGLVALAGGLDWYMLSLLPGLVASGGALLFGVNSWCLDGSGALWRDSLPVAPGLVFVSRVIVLTDVLLAATALTLGLAALRAGLPTVPQLVAVACAALVVTVQVVSASLRWSVRRPFAVDMRSARATPAPPLAMVGYSSRLAVSTTLTGMVFIATSRGEAWQVPVLVAVPFLLFSSVRLAGTARAWCTPETRSRVVVTVAG